MESGRRIETTPLLMGIRPDTSVLLNQRLPKTQWRQSKGPGYWMGGFGSRADDKGHFRPVSGIQFT